MRFNRWHSCSLCEQGTTASFLRARVGVLEDVSGRPEADSTRGMR